MKRVFLHSKEVIANHWFLICIAGAVSFVFAILAFALLLAYSLAFKQNPVDVNDVLNNFTDEELEIVLAETVDENVTDEEYLSILARYQSYFCPKKIDYMTTWTGAAVTEDSYILYYEIKRGFDSISEDRLRDNILTQINRDSVQTIRLARSQKNMVFRYSDRKTDASFDIVINATELMAA